MVPLSLPPAPRNLPVMGLSRPATASPPANRNGVSERRTAPTAPVAGSKWPLVSGAVYTKLARAGRLVEGDPELAKLNTKVVRLATARNRLYQALLAMDGALKETKGDGGANPDPKVYAALRAARPALEKLFLEFPLEVR